MALTARSTTMTRYRTSAEFDRAISEAAAARAVDDLLISMSKAGFDDTQAKAIANAAQEYLVHEPGYQQRARAILSAAAFVNGVANDILGEIEQTIASAASAKIAVVG